MMNTIYRATNTVNGKSYIGFDCKWPTRKIAHKSAAKRGENQVFYRAIRKYGWDAFVWEVLEQSEDGPTLLGEREEFWIRKFNTHCHGGAGYNMTYGGEGALGWVPTEEQRMKMSKANMGRPSWNKGKSAPWVSQRNRDNAGQPRLSRRKQYRITTPAGETFTITGLNHWAKENGLHPGNLCSVASGRMKHSKGYKCERI